MTGPSVSYHTNPRFVPDDIRIRFGGSDDAALIYDATNDELTIQTANLAGTLVDRVRFQANLDSPTVDMTGMRVNNLLAGFDDGSAASPALSFDADTDSGIYRIGADIVGVAVNGAEVARFGTAGERLGDNIKSLYGSGDDAAIYYDGTHLVIDPAEVGSGHAKIKDNDGTAFVRRIWLPASVFNDGFGSPTESQIVNASDPAANSGRAGTPVWLLDDASSESIVTTLVIPEDWDQTGAITRRIFVAPAAAQSAGSIFRIGTAIMALADGGTITSDVADSGLRRWTASDITVGNTADVIDIESGGTDGGTKDFVAGAFCMIQVGRQAAHVNDDRNGDCAFVGIEIQYDALR